MPRYYPFAGITLVLSTGIALWIAEISLSRYQKHISEYSEMDPGLLRYHSQFGWILSPSWSGNHRHHDFDVTYNIDAKGYRKDPHRLDEDWASNRSTETSSITTAAKKLKVGLLGDSFTFGLGVNDDQTFTSLLNQRDPNRSYLNLGTPGYSTDQQYLFLKFRHSRIKADHYLLFFYLGNDLLDLGLPYPLQAEYAKPYFELDGVKGLLQRNYPVPRDPKPAAMKQNTLSSVAFGPQLDSLQTLLQKFENSSELARRLLPKTAMNAQQSKSASEILSDRLSNQTEVLFRLLSQLKKDADSKQYKLSIALIPGHSYHSSPNNFSSLLQDYVRNEVIHQSQELGLALLDLSKYLQQAAGQTPAPLFHPNEGHLTTHGHSVVAKQVATFLNQ